jgi:TetR/AcrR family transcriptional regulator of autoinduction and epiphytic fitness
MERRNFRQQMLRTREQAILVSANRLLAEKGFETMTMDEVAADVGIAKASLYKHFVSKEELAGAAMVRVLDLALTRAEAIGAEPMPELERLKAMTRWTLEVQLAGEMPSLPAQNSALRAALTAHRGCLDRLMRLSQILGGWIEAAQRGGALNPAIAPAIVLYTLFARACDPVLSLLKAGGYHPDEEIVATLISTCFDGLARRTG